MGFKKLILLFYEDEIYRAGIQVFSMELLVNLLLMLGIKQKRSIRQASYSV